MQKQNKIYVFGPIYLFGENYLEVYKSVNKLCEKYFAKIIGTYPDFWDSKESPRDFYTRTKETIKDCDLFIAEVSNPSHGVGMELQMGIEQNIPTIAIIKEGVDFSKSTMVLGMPTLHSIITYKDLSDLLKKLDVELLKFTKGN